ncbi:MAG: hypothetical protein ACE5G8_04030 [Anaerolineae bacterium]
MTRSPFRSKLAAVRRRLIKRLLWLFTAALVLSLSADSVSPERAVDLTLAGFTSGQRFNWVTWEIKAVLQEAGWWLWGRPVPGDDASRRREVLDFLDRQRTVARLEYRLEQEYARRPRPDPGAPLPPDIAQLEQQLAALRARQADAAPRIERILSAQVSRVLAAEGIERQGQAWPPVTFRFSEMPSRLTLSPRDEIRTYRSLHLRPGLSAAARTKLEQAIEPAMDVSALVDDLGGIGSWPTMVTYTPSAGYLLDVIAHEWAHTYLLARPLGLAYDNSRDLTTMNETVASMVGEEVSRLTLDRFYPELLPPPAPPPEPPPPDKLPTKEGFFEAMRRIRRRVDSLLAEGRVAEAEAYMEAERLKLAKSGYYLRRLNQAYFAFHGSYATSPASIDPIGPWMRRLRAGSGSLKAFLERAANMDSLDDLLAAVGQAEP